MAENQDRSSHAASNESDQTKRPIPPTHIVIDPPLPAINGSQPKPHDGQNAAPEKPLPRFARPDWVIVYVTIVYAVIAWRTLRRIKRQADLMGRQNVVALASAKAAKESAKAANDNIELAINGQRAHIRVKPEPFKLEPTETAINRKAFYKIEFYGPTVAFIIDAVVKAEVTDSIEPSTESVFRDMRLPSIIAPGTEPRLEKTYFFQIVDEARVERIIQKESFIHFRGYIQYRDVFERERWTRFNQVWQYFERPNMDGTRGGRWLLCGSPEDNSQT